MIFFDLTPFFFIGQISLVLLSESKTLAKALIKSVGVTSVRTTVAKWVQSLHVMNYLNLFYTFFRPKRGFLVKVMNAELL